MSAWPYLPSPAGFVPTSIDGAAVTQLCSADRLWSHCDCTGAGGSGGTGGGGPCSSDKACAPTRQVCDPIGQRCVACVRDADCADGERCQESECVPITPCASSLDCVDDSLDRTICDEVAGECVECLSSGDCGKDADCVDRACEAYVPCASSLDCPSGQVCDKAAGRCVACVVDADCGADKKCAERECVPACTSDNDCTPLGLSAIERPAIACAASTTRIAPKQLIARSVTARSTSA